LLPFHASLAKWRGMGCLPDAVENEGDTLRQIRRVATRCAEEGGWSGDHRIAPILRRVVHDAEDHPSVFRGRRAAGKRQRLHRLAARDRVAWGAVFVRIFKVCGTTRCR